MTAAPLYIVDIMREVVTAADAVLFPTLGRHLFYTHGRGVQVQAKLQQLNDAIQPSTRASRWPLVALFQDFRQDMGAGYYANTRLPSLVIATLTDSTDETPDRYLKTFKPVLYPIYQELLRQLARHPNVVGGDPGAFVHSLWERPGNPPKGNVLNEYVDALEIEGLQLTIKQIKKCSP